MNIFRKIKTIIQSILGLTRQINEIDFNKIDTIITIELEPIEPIPLPKELVNEEADLKTLNNVRKQKLKFAEYAEIDGEEGELNSTSDILPYGLREILIVVNQAFQNIIRRSKAYNRELKLRLKSAEAKFNLSEEDYKKEIEGWVSAAVESKRHEIKRQKEASSARELRKKKELFTEERKVKERWIRNKIDDYGDSLKSKFYDENSGYWGGLFTLGILDIPVNQIIITVLLPFAYEWIAFIFAIAVTILLMVLAHSSGAQLDISNRSKILIKNQSKFWTPFLAGLAISILFLFLRLFLPDPGITSLFSGLLGIGFYLLSICLAAFRAENYAYFETKREVKKLDAKIGKLDAEIKSIEQPFDEALSKINESLSTSVNMLMRNGKSNLEWEIRQLKIRIEEIEDYKLGLLRELETVFLRLVSFYKSENLRARRLVGHSTNVQVFNNPLPKLKDLEQLIRQ